MKRVFRAVVVCGVLAVPTLASAQAAPAAPAQPAASATTSSSIIDAFYVGANGGGAVVENFSGMFGLDAGFRVWKSLDVVGELSWMGDVVTRRQLDRIGSVANFVKSGGATATGTMTVPAFYAGIGARWVFEQTGSIKPYALVTFGGAKYELKPVLTLSGTDVTANTSQYGVTLGQDVIGQYKAAAVTGGFGVVMKLRDNWYVDGGLRLTSLSEKDQRANVVRLLIGGGYRF